MAEVKEVTAGVRLGAQVQVRKFDIQADYEYSASKTIALEEGDDPNEVITEALTEIEEKLLEPKGQPHFEKLWGTRLKNEANKKLGDARGPA